MGCFRVFLAPQLNPDETKEKKVSWAGGFHGLRGFSFFEGSKDGKGEDTESKARDDRLDEANVK